MEKLKNALIEETERRIINESIPRIKQCLSYLTETEVWHSPNANCNSIGVLILHLCGNVRQWILSGACSLDDKRDRDSEFDPSIQPAKKELTIMLDKLGVDLHKNLPKINAHELLKVKPVQCYHETVFTMIVHAIEHFSYHTGQIVYITKSVKNIDTAFYAGQDLSAKG